MFSGDEYIRKFNGETYNKAPVERGLVLADLESVSTKGFIYLFAGSTALEAFSASNLASSFFCSAYKKFRRIIEEEIRHLGRSPRLIDNWHTNLISQLQGTLEEIPAISSRYGQRVNARDLEAYQAEINNFADSLHEPFHTLGRIVVETQDFRDSPPSLEVRAICTRIFENEHSRGKNWFLSLIRNVDTVNSAELIFKNANLLNFQCDPSNKPGLQITTEFNSNIRYIKLTFSLQELGFREFLLLSFKFLHEYFSHLYACLISVEASRNLLAVGSHTKVCTSFKDGWLLHTIHEFCIDNLLTLLCAGELDGYSFCKLEHLRHDFTHQIREYVDSLRFSEGGTYSTLSDRGQTLACEFLRFLSQGIGNDAIARERAKALYYKLSSHLILYCPSDDFSQEKFMDCLEVGIKHHKTQFQEILVSCIQGTNCDEFINLDCLWSQIRNMEYELNLE